MLKESQIQSFLYYGYIPETIPDEYLNFFSKLNLEKLDGYDVNSLVNKGVDALSKSFIKLGNACFVIPLSGGYDSRIILAMLLELGLQSNITAVTFGLPGTFDFDIGSTIAEKLGLDHAQIDLSSAMITQDELENTIRNTGVVIWPFDAFYNSFIPNMFGKDVVYWRGFLGETLAGAFYPSRESNTWDEAIFKFSVKNRFSRSIDISAVYYDPRSSLSQEPFIDKELISYDEQLAIIYYQWLWSKNLKVFEKYRVRTPFLNVNWINFILSIPKKYRIDRYLYREILKEINPFLADLPSESNLGLPISAPAWRSNIRRLRLGFIRRMKRFLPGLPWRIDPMTNYIDFNKELRQPGEFKTVIHENLRRLIDSNVVDWIDIRGVWENHQNFGKNHADALTLLAALQMNLNVFGGTDYE